MIRFKTLSGSEYWVDYPRWGRTTRSGGLDHLDANEGVLRDLRMNTIDQPFAGVTLYDEVQGPITTTRVVEFWVDGETSRPESVAVTESLAELRLASTYVQSELTRLAQRRLGRADVHVPIEDAEQLILGVERHGYRLVKSAD